ncbi:GAF domain-containing protein [Marinobacter bohaiensis]|uniref:GAF domain-containing protein n=1 Tax=Marinobacter bohaiensis TaxID=2201898 RepID=UPI000DACD4CD|nr:GAF domain-containing protein [Marinobacter bohaiensis]
MEAPEKPSNERERQQAVDATRLVGSAPEERFDRLTRLARDLFDVEIALVTLVDRDRQWFKSCQGLDADETPRSVSFCGHAILESRTLVVENALEDRRFADNPLVVGPPNIRFYAGAPLHSPDGYRLGTLCIIDPRPRTFSPEDGRKLRDLADCVEREIAASERDRYHQALEALARLQTDNAGTPWQTLNAGLRLGADYLRLPFGIISQIERNLYRVATQVSPPETLEDGQTFDFRHTYCEITLAADGIMVIDHMAESEYASHPCYRDFQLESYIGMPLTVAGKPYGTLNFSSPEPRKPNGFSRWDRDFLVLLTGWVERVLDRWYADQSLDWLRRMEMAMARAQGAYISDQDRASVFDGLLADLLDLTGCPQGFIGEVLRDAAGQPCMKTYASTQTGRASPGRAPALHANTYGFPGLEALIDDVIRTEAAVLAGEPANDGQQSGQGGANGYLGLPIHHGDRLMGVVGLANKSSGFTWEIAGQLKPLLRTIGQLIEAERGEAAKREAEDTLRNSESRLRALFELSPVGIALIDFDSDRFLDVNDAVLSSSGHSRSELQRTAMRDITPDRYTDRDAEEYRALLSEGHFGPYEKELLHRDGHAYPVMTHSVLVEDQGGGRVIWRIVEDITERKRLARLQREFISTVSHELRTPLTALSGSLKLIDQGVVGELPRKGAEMIALAYRNSERLVALINDLLDMEKLVAGKMTFRMASVSVDELLQAVVQENQAYANRFDVQIVLDNRAPGVTLLTDEMRFGQVMANLLSNAAKFSPARGRVEVRVDALGDRLRVAVSDQGPGIPDEFRSRIFSAFAQADSSDTRSKGGTGLGLAICRELVERMEGRIDFESEPGRGATFHFELPGLDAGEGERSHG